jgi:hypothetical protein
MRLMSLSVVVSLVVTIIASWPIESLAQQKSVGPGQKPSVGGLRAAPLTDGECQKLGCTVILDRTCTPVGGLPLGVLKLGRRCSCPGGGNKCIDKAA